MRLAQPADYESGGQEFESLRARHFGIRYCRHMPPISRSEPVSCLRGIKHHTILETYDDGRKFKCTGLHRHRNSTSICCSFSWEWPPVLFGNLTPPFRWVVPLANRPIALYSSSPVPRRLSTCANCDADRAADARSFQTCRVPWRV